MSFKLCSFAPFITRNRRLHSAREILAGKRARTIRDFCQAALRNDFSAGHTGPRAHIDDVVRRLDGLLIMFHNDHGVAGIPQLLEQHNELRVVFLVQSDTGLVENIKDPRQVRSELCSEPHPLSLATRESHGRSIEG